jgi:hypothetical protein
MDVQEFLAKQSKEAKDIFIVLDELIRKCDKKVQVKVEALMSVPEALAYHQEGVFKYGLTATSKHYSYHSMVMYAYPELLDDLKKEAKDLKFQKGCINFQSLEQVQGSLFEDFLMRSAQKDFQPIIDRYKKKK